MPRATYLALRAYQKARLVRAGLRIRPVTWTGVRILGYHSVTEASDTLSVPPVQFRAQIEAALESGARPLRLRDALDLLNEPVSGKYFCVTFDDGYLDNLERAEPILREFGVPGTIFAPTSVIDGETDYFWRIKPPPALTWEQIGALVSGGLLDVQSHTKTHAWLPQLSDEEAWHEIADSKTVLEAHVPYQITSIAYPGGHYTSREMQLTRRAGYRAGVTTRPGVNPGGRQPYALRRTLIYREDSLATFTTKFSGLLDRPPLFREVVYRQLARFRDRP